MMAGPSQRDLADRIELAQQSSTDWQARHDVHSAQYDGSSSSSEDEQRDSTLPMYRSRSHSLINARPPQSSEPEPPLPTRPSQHPAFPSSGLPPGARAAVRHPHGFEELPKEPRVIENDFAKRDAEASSRSGRSRQDTTTTTTTSSKSRKVDWKDVQTDTKINDREASDGGSMPPLSRQNSEFDVDDDNGKAFCGEICTIY